ncbi:MAG TPA: hypothetical protein VGC39_05885 [Candidatus Methylacidiphilales bacterium]
MTGTEIYKRTAAYERDAKAIRLHAPQWKLLLAYDGQRSLAEVALSAEVSFADALPLTERFLSQGWIEEQPITLDQYLKRTGAPSLSAIGSSVPPAITLHAPKPESGTPPPIPLPFVVEKTDTVPLPSFSLPSQKSSRDPLRLQALVNYLTSLADNVGLGQIIVYRVFLRVPPELLQAEDIATVHLLGDTSLIKSEKLQQAIANAVSEVTHRALPSSLFASA